MLGEKQWLRYCGRCEWLFIGKHKDCPRCHSVHYGAPFVYNSYLLLLLLKQTMLAGYLHPAKWWQFWYPQSGFASGLFLDTFLLLIR